MRYRLRTLLIATGLLPPLLAWVWFAVIWIIRQYSSPVAERPVVFTVSLVIGVGLVSWVALTRCLAGRTPSTR